MIRWNNTRSTAAISPLDPGSFLLVLAHYLHRQTTFTAVDQLEVQSLNNVAISPDGRYAVEIRYKGSRSRLDVDHFRFGDPTYIRPFRGELVIFDLEKQEKYLPFKRPAR